MRHILLALLIALLPLRGWVSDAMAVAQVTHPAAKGAAEAAHLPAESPIAASSMGSVPHCDEHLGLHDEAQGLADAGHALTTEHSLHAEHLKAASCCDTENHAHQHKSCEVCNGPAMALPALDAVGLELPHAVQQIPTERFASTVLPQGIKPPIS